MHTHTLACTHTRQTMFLNDTMRFQSRKFPFKPNPRGIKKADGSIYLAGEDLRVLDIQFIQCFDVVAGERNRDQEDVLPPPLTKPLDGLICLRAQPGYRTNLGKGG